jgi:SpoIID/LytB domain protein
MNRNILLATLLITSVNLSGLEAKVKPTSKSKQKQQIIEPKAPTIKVLIKKDTCGALVESKGKFEITNPQTQKILSSGNKGKRYYLHAQEDGLRWGEGFPGVYQIKLSGSTPNDTFLVDGIEYDGTLEIFDVDHQVNIINEITVENYLKHWMGYLFDGEHTDQKVLKALSIVLRTQLYHTLLKGQNAFWQIDGAKTNFLGHSGALLDKYIDEAVDSTKTVILTYHYKPFSAEWTKHSAGMTATYPAIFRKNILSPLGVEAPLARKDREKSRWSFTIPRTEFAQLVKTNRISGIDTFVDNFSKRVYAVRINDGHHHVDFDYFAFQKLLGLPQLKSNEFTISLEKDHVRFDGYGSGPGVGLCLYSAEEMSKRGDSVEQILLDFFPGTLLQEIKSLDFSKDGLDEF